MLLSKYLFTTAQRDHDVFNLGKNHRINVFSPVIPAHFSVIFAGNKFPFKMVALNNLVVNHFKMVTRRITVYCLISSTSSLHFSCCEKPMKIEEFKYICAPACHSDTCLKMLCNVWIMLLVFDRDYRCRKKGIKVHLFINNEQRCCSAMFLQHCSINIVQSTLFNQHCSINIVQSIPVIAC